MQTLVLLVVGLLLVQLYFLAPKPFKPLVVLAPALVAGIAFLFFPKGVFSVGHLLVVLLTVSVLLPHIPLPAGLPRMRLEQPIIVSVWLMLAAVAVLRHKYFTVVVPPPARVLFLLILYIGFSIGYGGLVLGNDISGRDFFENLKSFVYLLIFLFVSSNYIDKNDFWKFFKYLFIIFSISALFGIFQRYNLLGINGYLTPLYAQGRHLAAVAGRGHRIVGTSPNPNEFGGLMVLTATVSLSIVLLVPHWKRRLFGLGLFCLFGYTLILTQSRTSLVALAVSLFVLLFVLYPFSRGFGSLFAALMPLGIFAALGAVAVWLFVPDAILDRFAQLGRVWEATSFLARVAKWGGQYASWMESPLFGHGPGKLVLVGGDSEWLLFLRRYGLIGTGLLILFGASIFRGLGRIARRVGRDMPELRAYCLGLQATLFGFAAYMIPANVYHSLWLFPIYMLSLGMAFSFWPEARSSARPVGRAPAPTGLPSLQ